MNQVNKVTMYFNQNKKANILLFGKETKIEVTHDRLRCLKHDFSTRWNSQLGAMLNHVKKIDNIAEETVELGVSGNKLHHFSTEQKDGVIKKITLLSQVLQVARQLKNDQRITLGRAASLFDKLYMTIKALGGIMLLNSKAFSETATFNTKLELVNDDTLEDSMHSTCSILSFVEPFRCISEVWEIEVYKWLERELALVLA